jgi:hypothetical protein
MRLSRLSLLVLALQFSGAFAAPRFEDFPAASYAGQSAKVRLADARSRLYASQLRAAAQGSPDFAGRHILAMWGCGASCVMAAAIDTNTGAVAWLPFTVCCWNLSISEPLEHRRDSRLLIVHGSRDEKGPGNAVHYYAFDGRKFSPLKVESR